LNPLNDSEELVWRRGQLPTVVAENDRRQDRTGWSDPVRSSAQAAAVAASEVVELGKSQPAARLDPALLERLTDDVIRRVEQRLRIERQRRGL
jgi:hypothetical protein